jgi:SAM-dependent methyltransferase
MPGSSALFDPQIQHFLSRVTITSMLDIGCGSGKYGRFMRDIHPNAVTEGYEIDPEYPDQFGLRDVYTTLYQESGMNVLDRVDAQWDLVTIGDCIEHLKKSDGTDLINFLVYRCKYLLVVWPHAFLQGAWEGHHHEAHISVWSRQDFAPFDHVYRENGPMRLAGVDGYLRTHELSVRSLL